ncbi:MAG TPA: hypothetical protein VKQ71_02130 [Acidimicrobiales bacterium]|nr:hypothetical protein [Acidimicrobiales bacterium]
MSEVSQDLDPDSVTYAEAQAETQGGAECQLADDDITGILQQYGVTDDPGAT